MASLPPDIVIRTETPDDAGAISSVHRQAFADHPHSDQTEHLIVERLRERGQLVVSLVAELGGAVVGHIALSPVLVDGLACGWFGLGPVGVLPACQGKGIGAALVEHGLAALREHGAAGCVVLGEPLYYGRFGFHAHENLRYPGPPPDCFMALAFHGALPSGVVAYDPAFG